MRGRLNLSLSFAGTWTATGHEEACPEIGPGCATMPVPPEWHDLRLFFGELRLHTDYGITDWLAADLTWSLRIVRTDYRLLDAATRQPIEYPFGPDIHHRTETLVGPSDPWLGLKVTVAPGPWSFRLRAGATLPVGSTVENPFALARDGKVHQHVQLGSGTVDPFAEVAASRRFGGTSVEAWLLGKAALYRNRHDYQAGNQLLGGVRASSDLGTARWRFVLGLLAYHEEAERWSGVVEDEGNLGRTDLIAETQVAWLFADRFALTLGLRVPVATWATGAQLNTPAIADVGLSRAFDLLGGGAAATR